MAGLKTFGFLALMLLVSAWIINAYIVVKTKAHIFTDCALAPAVEAVIVPGASVYRSGKLSPVLRQRMEGALQYMDVRPGSKLFLSGYSIPHGYNETVAMVDFARRRSVPKETILIDEKGRSTYVTLLNFRRAYGNRSILIVSQDYHLPRAVYIARTMGMEASGLVVTGAPAGSHIPFREYFVRLKDFILLRISKWFNAN